MQLLYEKIRKWNSGKLSERREVKIIVSNLREFTFNITWSIRVAVVTVHLVGLVTTCNIPWENNRSTYSVNKLLDPYFKQSRVMSPKM